MSQSCKATVGVVRSRWFDSRYIYGVEDESLVIILIIAFRALKCIGRAGESCATVGFCAIVRYICCFIGM
jgi:hypothetical protein